MASPDWRGLHVFQHAGDAAQLRCRPEQGTLGGFLFTVGGLRQETLELFQGSCVHVGYSLSDNGTVSRSGSLRKSYVAEKVFFCPQKRARAAVSIAISYRLFYV